MSTTKNLQIIEKTIEELAKEAKNNFSKLSKNERTKFLSAQEKQIQLQLLKKASIANPTILLNGIKSTTV